LVPGHRCEQHVTPNLATLTNSAPYLGNDHVHVGDSKGLSISHIGHTMLRSPKHTFILSNVLHAPHITKPLLSVQKFYRDNNVYFEFHTFVFYVKDLTTKVVLLSGHNNDGLCHDPNPGSVTDNVGVVPEGHPSRAKPQNGHIKRIIYSKIRSIS